MKTSMPAVVLVSVVSSVAIVGAIVGAIELLRGTYSLSKPAQAVERPLAPSAAPREPEPQAPATHALDPPAEHADRLAEIERRLAALELGPTRQPAAATSAERLPPQEELRDLVLEWVAADRKARGRAAELEQEDERRAQQEFSARYQAHMLAQEHGLEPWQEEEFAALFLEMGERAAEIEDSIDPESDDPEEVEARWEEFDEWVDRLERELTARLDPELYAKIYGED